MLNLNINQLSIPILGSFFASRGFDLIEIKHRNFFQSPFLGLSLLLVKVSKQVLASLAKCFQSPFLGLSLLLNMKVVYPKTIEDSFQSPFLGLSLLLKLVDERKITLRFFAFNPHSWVFLCFK